MRTTLLVVASGLIFGLGYILGATGALNPAHILAQNEPKTDEAKPAAGNQLSDESRTKIKEAADAVKAAMEALQLEQRYTPATKGVNTFAVLTGGCTAVADLEAGNGVDPETYAALYAGLANDDLQEKIGFNARQQLTYNGKPVALVSKNRLKALYATRAAITGEELPGIQAAPAAEKKAEPTTEANP